MLTILLSDAMRVLVRNTPVMSVLIVTFRDTYIEKASMYACWVQYETRNIPTHDIVQCVILRLIDKRNTRTFLNRGLLRFYNWHLSATGMQNCHVQRKCRYSLHAVQRV